MKARRIAGILVVTIAVAAAFAVGWLIGSDGERPAWFAAGVAHVTQWAAPDQVEQAEPEPPPFPPPSPPVAGEATILFVGDVLPLEDRDYFEKARPLISGADFAVCNLECPLSTHGARTPLKFDGRGRVIQREYFFRASPSQAGRLVDAGFDAVTLANNHIMDYGGEALLETLAALEHAGLKHVGAGPDLQAAREPMVFEVEGQTVAVIAYVSALTLPGTDHFAATDETAGTVFVSGGQDGRPSEQCRQMVRNDIRAARSLADFVVASFHWGREASKEPAALPRSLAHWSIDCGADMVVAHHPHVLQGIEIYQGRPIAYSLGNFAFPTSWETNHFSGALEVRLSGGAWQELVLHPVMLRFRAGDPAPAQGADLRRIVDRVMSLSADLGTTCEFIEDEGNPRVVIANTEAAPARSGLLKAEEARFHVAPHPELAGMSTVHFLAWDLEGDGKVAKSRSLVVASALAQETLEIFREIYLDPEQFPIHDLVGYNYRTIAGGTGLSNHALGRAIDINRAENPMIQGGEMIVHPDEPPYEPGEWRPGEDPYSITPDGPVVRAFKSRGWHWGGDWTSCKDYQHFDRPRR